MVVVFVALDLAIPVLCEFASPTIGRFIGCWDQVVESMGRFLDVVWYNFSVTQSIEYITLLNYRL